MAKTIDATKIPATVTITNTNAVVEMEKDGQNKYEGYVKIPVYRVLTQEIELAPQDVLKLVVTTSAELLFYMALGNQIEGITVEVAEITE